jgi:3-hydroxyisobutyrate dehydrogenase
VTAAEKGILTFMVGANSKSDFDQVKPYLECMGKNVVHAGPVGSGLAAKICNNMLLGISMIGVAETMNLGIKLGLDKKVLAGIINTSSGRCWSSDLYNPVPGVIDGIPPSKDYEGGFGTALMTKDLSLAQNASIETQTPTPMGGMAYNLYKLLCINGYSKKDFAVVYKYFEQQK